MLKFDIKGCIDPGSIKRNALARIDVTVDGCITPLTTKLKLKITFSREIRKHTELLAPPPSDTQPLVVLLVPHAIRLLLIQLSMAPSHIRTMQSAFLLINCADAVIAQQYMQPLSQEKNLKSLWWTSRKFS
jgi:hypothetical protein